MDTGNHVPCFCLVLPICSCLNCIMAATDASVLWDGICFHGAHRKCFCEHVDIICNLLLYLTNRGPYDVKPLRNSTHITQHFCDVTLYLSINNVSSNTNQTFLMANRSWARKLCSNCLCNKCSKQFSWTASNVWCHLDFHRKSCLSYQLEYPFNKDPFLWFLCWDYHHDLQNMSNHQTSVFFTLVKKSLSLLWKSFSVRLKVKGQNEDWSFQFSGGEISCWWTLIKMPLGIEGVM